MTRQAVDIIRKKRDGLSLSAGEIDAFLGGVMSGEIADYQAAAFLMAVLLRGMTIDETAWLTDAMIRSGVRLDLSDVPGPKVDKHSTGGVGDKTSLVIAPLAAACGVRVPMMSGRALGHTGGTVDKLESIPGFRVELAEDELRRALRSIGCVLISQTARLAPADRILYALRDVTGTVESLPLICASILSKKIAEGVDAVILDVKAGRGTFMASEAEARRLAEALVAIGTRFGVRTEALITSMDAPLGRAVGNALEVVESIETLKGRGPADLEALSVELTARMIVLGGLATTAEEAVGMVRAALGSGAGLEKFRQVVAQQGGDPGVIDRYDLLPRAPHRHLFGAPADGWLTGLDAGLIGRASMRLGAGRARAGEAIDPAVGLVLLATPGDCVRAGDPLVEFHYRTEASLAEALPLVAGAVRIEEAPASRRPLVLGAVA